MLYSAYVLLVNKSEKSQISIQILDLINDLNEQL